MVRDARIMIDDTLGYLLPGRDAKVQCSASVEGARDPAPRLNHRKPDPRLAQPLDAHRAQRPIREIALFCENFVIFSNFLNISSNFLKCFEKNFF